MSTIITCIMCLMLYIMKCKPINKVANCVFRLFETCEIEDRFPTLTSKHDGSHVVLCLGSKLCNQTCQRLDPSRLEEPGGVGS